MQKCNKNILNLIIPKLKFKNAMKTNEISTIPILRFKSAMKTNEIQQFRY